MALQLWKVRSTPQDPFPPGPFHIRIDFLHSRLWKAVLCDWMVPPLLHDQSLISHCRWTELLSSWNWKERRQRASVSSRTGGVSSFRRSHCKITINTLVINNRDFNLGVSTNTHGPTRRLISRLRLTCGNVPSLLEQFHGRIGGTLKFREGYCRQRVQVISEIR